jgi:deoxyribodipyrimidine photolyase
MSPHLRVGVLAPCTAYLDCSAHLEDTIALDEDGAIANRLADHGQHDIGKVNSAHPRI